MISAKLLARQLEKYTQDNAPVLLTGVGAVGAIVSSVLMVRATFKTADLVRDECTERWQMNPAPDPEYPVLTPVEVAKIGWKEYIPAVGALTVTVSAIVFANHISTKRAAALAAAYSLSDRAYTEYREKVAEKFNANKERQVRDEIAQDRVKDHPPTDRQVIITGNGNVLCYDTPSDRYFQSNMERLRTLQNDINQQVNEVGFANLDAFYVALGLNPTPYSEELGWTTAELFDIKFSAVLTDENTPCVCINYSFKPTRGGDMFQVAGATEPPF